MQFLVEPSSIGGSLPSGARPLPAGRDTDLHAALRNVVTAQPEFAAWAPSRLCLLYFSRIEAGGVRVSHPDLRKAPMLGLWTVAVEGPRGRRDVALEIFVNSSRLDRPAQLAGMEIRRVRTSVAPLPDDEDGRPSPDDRYSVRLGKSQIIWDGRPAGDSTHMDSALTAAWRVEGRKGRWLDGELTLRARLTGSMIGSLKVQGEGDLAEMLVRSPARFVGPVYVGGSGTLRVRH